MYGFMLLGDCHRNRAGGGAVRVAGTPPNRLRLEQN